MASKLQKIIDRTQDKISNGQYYEAHQAVRTIATRYIRTKNYSDAIEVLYSSAKLLLEADQPGSASDLILYLVETLKTAEIPIDSVYRAKVVQLVKLFKPGEPTLKSISQETISWSIVLKENENSSPYGDAELHHVFGSIFATAGEAYEAEKHLLLGTSESPKVLAELLFEWYTEDPEPSTAGLYASRGVLGYLVIENIRDARKLLSVFLDKFIAKLESSSPSSPSYTIATEYGQSIIIFNDDDNAIINFLQLLVITCQSKNGDMFNRLKLRYKSYLDDIDAFHAPLERIGLEYFGIQPPRNNNVLQNLMGSIFGGGVPPQ